EFNRVRTACFKQWGLIHPEREGVLPASTGIQGRRHPGEECFMDVFALARKDGGRDGIEPMHNTRQNEAYEYGSSFCRGMTVSLDGPATHYVSGTASIDPLGRTVYHGDHQGQVVETLLDVHALLGGSDAAFRDICQATAYCKEERDYRTFLRMLEFMDWKDMPVIPVYADVCRDELLFEMDAIAVAR
ncbi:MAG: RidA family protein, partial [Planctomycetota bacterium]